VGHADHRDDAGGGAGAAGQPLDLTQVVHAHLHHGVPGVVIQAEQGVGHTDVVVLVALGLEGFAKGGEDGVAEFFGGGLAHTAGNADHLGAEQHAVVGGHADHGAGAVRHDDSAVLGHAVHGVVGDDIGGAVPVSTGGEGMAVDALTGEADEHAAGLDLAAVGNNSVDVRRLGQSQASQQFVGRNGLHGIASLFYGYASSMSGGKPPRGGLWAVYCSVFSSTASSVVSSTWVSVVSVVSAVSLPSDSIVRVTMVP